MKSNQLFLAVLACLTLGVSACAPQAAPAAVPTQPPATEAPTAMPAATEAPTTAAPAATEAPTTAAPAPSGQAMVDASNNAQLGSFLVDGSGMTLYLFTKDSPGTSVCYDKCATAWPPLLTSGTATAGSGVDDGKFGTTTRTDGTTQVTYNGWPLYYYEKDKQPGDTTGQGVGSVWYLISPSGDAVK